jgi:hypothetical protein
VHKYSDEQDIDVCALKLVPAVLDICVLPVYRAASGNDINIDYSIDNDKKGNWTLY